MSRGRRPVDFTIKSRSGNEEWRIRFVIGHFEHAQQERLSHSM
jgi:hypothetical protein